MFPYIFLINWLIGPALSYPEFVKRDNVIFSEDFENGNLNQWDYQACLGGVTISTDVARTGTHSAKFVVYNNSTDSNCQDVPTDNPRAQIVSPGLFSNGDEYYTAVSVSFPEKFPQPNDWFQLIEFYGPPYEGSPTMGVDICNGNHICFQQDESHNYANIWQSSEIQLGEWRDLVFHINFSTDENTGFVEIYDGGELQTMSNGESRTYYQTLNPNCNWDGTTPNSLYLNQYRAQDSDSGGVTLYQDSVKVGSSLAVVTPPIDNGSAPSSYREI